MVKRCAVQLGLKAQALALLARREYSRAELREKLAQHARKLAAHAAEAASECHADPEDPGAAAGGSVFQRSRDRHRDSEAGLTEVEQLLDWLQAERHQSDERFLEGRVRRRAPGLGQARIRQELGRHGLQMAPAMTSELKASEFDRARALWMRRYGEPATEAAARAKQTRFLVARGFSLEVVGRVVSGCEE